MPADAAAGPRPDAGDPRGTGRDAERALRFGVLCGGPRLRAWQVWCLEELLEVEATELAVVVEGEAATEPGRRGSVLWRRYRRRFLDGASEALEEVDVDEAFPGVPTLSRDSAAAARVPEAGFDFLLDLGLGPVDGTPPRSDRPAGAARHGLWTFRFGLPERSDDPPGFREILRGEPLVEAALERVAGPDGRTILHEGRLRLVDDSYAQTLDHVLRTCAAWPARVCREIRTGAGPREAPTGARRAPPRRRSSGGSGGERPSSGAGRPVEGAPSRPSRRPAPSNRETLRFLARLLRNYLRNILDWHLRFATWNVGMSPDVDLGGLVDEGRLPDVTWAPPAPAPLRTADPFGVVEDGRLRVLAERFGHHGVGGTIVALDAGRPTEGAALPVPRDAPSAFDAEVHCAYPYLFRFGGDLFCVPDTFQAREVRLYRARRLPDEWERVGTLLEDFAAVDPTIFRHGDRWWLFCTDGDVGSQTVLHAWHAERPTGPWRPHALNPLKSDVRSSRPGGTPFRHEGKLYRPAQDCSERYGGAIALNRVRRLTPTEFEETTVRYLEPDPGGPYPHGLHTLSLADGCLLVDGMRKRFVPEAFFKRLGAQLGL